MGRSGYDVGMYFGTRYRRDVQVTLLCCALGMLGVISILMVICFPQYGIDPSSYGIDASSQGTAWRGVFETKNMLGRAMVLATIAMCCSRPNELSGKLLRVGWVAGFGALIVLSRSATACVTGAMLFVFMLTYRLVRSRVTTLFVFAIVSLCVVALLAVVVIDQRDAFLELLGREEETLTGRIPLWDSVLVAIGKNPLLGYGFNSFWNGENGPSATVVNSVGWSAPHAHNGFLDLCLDLGVVGLK